MYVCMYACMGFTLTFASRSMVDSRSLRSPPPQLRKAGKSADMSLAPRLLREAASVACA